MARHPERSAEEQTQPQTTETQAPASTTAAAPTAPDERYRKVVVDAEGSTFAYNDSSKSGVTVNRIDFIRAAWQIGRKARGAIAKELTRLTGKKVTYQIVFSATKGQPGGPVAPAQPQTAA
jgi:hypothetical protein